MDGGYVIKRFEKENRRFPAVGDVQSLAAFLLDSLSGADLYRIFFYNADPYRGSEIRPLDAKEIRFADTKTARYGARLVEGLEEAEDFAVRRGELAFRGWRVGESAGRSLRREPRRMLSASDFVPDLVQKGVDMRIGLDIAALALKRLVDTVVLVTGDADMVPAMRFARREGLRVGLCTLGFEGIRRELRAHADFMLDWNPDVAAAPAPTATVPSPWSGKPKPALGVPSNQGSD